MSRRAWLWAMGLVVFAALLRAPGVAWFPYEQDELYTVLESTQLFHTTLKPGIEARPFFYLLQHVVLQVLPLTPMTLRLLAMSFGLAGVWVTWLLGARLFGVTAGLVAEFLAAISPWHLYVAGFARYYSLLYLLAALFYLSLATAYQSDRPRDYAWTLGAAALGSVTHPSFLLPVIGVMLAVTIVTGDGRLGWRWPTPRAWRYLWLPWAALLGVGYLALRLTAHSSAVENLGSRGMTATLRLVPAMVQWMTPPVFVAGGVGALLLLSTRARPGDRRWGMMTLLGCASALGLLVTASTRTGVYADYGIGMLPLLLAAAGAIIQRGAEELPSARGVFPAAVTAVIAAGVAPSTASHLVDGTRFDYRPAFTHIAAMGPEVTVLTWPEILAKQYAPQLKRRPLTFTRQYLDSLLAVERDLWIVASVREYGLVGDDSGEGVEWLATQCRRVAAHQRMRFDSRVYRVELYRCGAGLRP